METHLSDQVKYSFVIISIDFVFSIKYMQFNEIYTTKRFQYCTSETHLFRI
jgi:hypothetical protein